MENSKLLEIKDLVVSFPTEEGSFDAVRGSSFSVERGETLAIVGESGSGKSLTALSILGLLPLSGELVGGEILFETKNNGLVDLAKLSPAALQKIRGGEIAMIFQEPMSSLNPVMCCGEQVAEVLRYHFKKNKTEAREEVLSLFEKVKLQEPARIYRSYPHQLSGGQRQRVMIAMAICGNPSVLIADEPTSSLDVSVQSSILDLLKELKTEWGGSLIFITHDLAIGSGIADRLLVMHKGKIVEQGTVREVFNNPKFEYTRQLLEDSKFKREKRIATETKQANPILEASQVSTWFPAGKTFFGKPQKYVKAVQEVSLEIYPGETLGLVGESGSGKTSLGRTLLFLEKPVAGQVFYEKRPLAALEGKEWKSLRKELQIIFQDPYTSLNPRIPIGEAICEPMLVHGLWKNQEECRNQALHLLEKVGLEASYYWRYPDEFSGGQRQRVCIARVLALQPRVIICDECVSALDVTVQRQVLDLLIELQRELGLAFIFISHDLSVVRYISDRVAVMKDGQIIETGKTEQIWKYPQQDYTKQLLKSIPRFHS